MQEKKSTNATFSKRIKALMESKGLTEKALCEKKKNSQSELSAWFRERGEPSVGVLFALSEALEVSVSELWLGKPENTEEVAIKGGNSFSERLQAVMREKALTQADLCKLTDIPKCSMSHYVNGTQQPRKEKLVCISRALGVNAEWLQHGEGESEQSQQEITNSIQWLEIKRLRKDNDELRKENEQLKEQLQGHDSNIEGDVLRVKTQRAREEVEKLSSTVAGSVNVLRETLAPPALRSKEEDNITLYHFTSLENALKIVKEDAFKCSSPIWGNDPSEFLPAFQHAEQREVFEERFRSDNMLYISLAENYKSMAMWGHYAKQHRGVCLGYSFPRGFLENIKQITENVIGGIYRVKYSHGRVMWSHDRNRKDIIRDLMTTKDISWKPEKEYRILPESGYFEKDGNVFLGGFNCYLREVIIGMKAVCHAHVFRLLGANRSLKFKLYQARLSRNTFEIETIDLQTP